MIEKTVKKVIGIEDAPKWLEQEVLKKIEEGFDVESAVNYLAPWIQQIYWNNLAKHRPGCGLIRKVACIIGLVVGGLSPPAACPRCL